MDKIAILIPCYNEEFTIEKVIKDFRNELPDAEIYVYDNNSTDKTFEIAKSSGAIVRREYRQGKGNVVRRMFREIDADIYVMVDGDDTYPAQEIHKLISPIRNNEADMVIGDRITNGTYKNANKRLFHSFGNELVKKTINFLFKTELKDIMSGYRTFSNFFVKNMPVLSENFEVETEMTLHALDKKFNIKEISIVYRDRPKGSFSKLNTIKDGLKVLGSIFKMFKDFRPGRFFGVMSIMCFLLGLGIGIPVVVEFIQTSYVSKVPSAILATGIMIFAIVIAQCGVILDTITKQNREKYELLLVRYEQRNKLIE